MQLIYIFHTTFDILRKRFHNSISLQYTFYITFHVSYFLKGKMMSPCYIKRANIATIFIKTEIENQLKSK
jgi:hypothetical protein